MYEAPSDKPRVFTHTDPVWREKANFIIMAPADDEVEQLGLES